MGDDVDIYADLPGFSSEKNDQDCNCKEFKSELSSLASKLEDIQTTKATLERNLSSLLKTARAEIARKDKMIDDLRRRLDDVAFRRGSSRSETPGVSTRRLAYQHTAVRKYENIPSTRSQESETETHQAEFHHDEYKSRKPQADVIRVPTLFAERLQKRILEGEKEEKRQNALKPGVEAQLEDVPEDDVAENDRENGSQFSVNNNGNESNIGRRSNSGSPERNAHRRILSKRTNEEDDTHRHKRLKIENEDKATTEETDYNYLMPYHLTDNPAACEIKDTVKFEDRPSAVHSFKKEEAVSYSERRATSEYRDTKQDQTCANGWRNAARDHDSLNARNELADNSRNPRTALTSNYVSEGFSSRYKRNGHRYSPPRRSYSRSRSDYESSSSRLRDRYSRAYKEKKYDDYRYDSRYNNGRLKWNYKTEENDRKTRHARRERERDRSRYSSSDAEDRESSSYKNYENRSMRKEKGTALSDKRPYESNKAAVEANFRESSSRTIVNSTTNYSVEKDIEQRKVKNESEIKNSVKSTFARVATEGSVALEEGEILDSPEKRNNSATISKNNKMEESNVRGVPVEDRKEDISVGASIDSKSTSLQKKAHSTKQLEVADISTRKAEETSHLLQRSTKDREEIIQPSSSKSNMAIDEACNCRKDEDSWKFYVNEDLMDSVAENVGAIEQVRGSDADYKNDADETSKDSETAVIETTKIKEKTATESVAKIKESDACSIESAANKEEMDNPTIERVVEVTEVNNSGNRIHRIHRNTNGDELKISIIKIAIKAEAVSDCGIEGGAKSHAPIESGTSRQMSTKSNVEMCLNDHNYVQKSFINVPDPDVTQEPPRPVCGEAAAESVKLQLPEAVSRETKVEGTINVQSVNSVKRTTSSTVKAKKGQQSKGILISHRRKAVILSDSNASMTVLMNASIAKTSSVVSNCDGNDAASVKPRACKIPRATVKAACK